MLKKTTLIILCFAMFVFFVACSPTNDSVTTPIQESETQNFSIYDIGGYSIDANSLSCEILTDGNQYLLRYQSLNSERQVLCYANTEEVILIDTIHGETKYSSLKNDMFTFQHPLNTMVKQFNQLSAFETDVEIVDNNVYLISTINSQHKEQNIKTQFIVSEIEMIWCDNQTYKYKYYDYSNGKTCVSDSAPDDLKNNYQNWKIDIDQSTITNSITDQKLPINVLTISIGYGELPQSLQETKNQITKIYTNQQTGFVDKIIQETSQSTITINVINHNPEIQKPKIEDSYIPMTQQESTSALLLAHTLSQLI